METEQIIRKAIQDNINRETIGTAIFDIMVETFKPFEGKPISKRLATALQKAMPEHTIHYEKEFGMYHIKIWGCGIHYNDRMSFLIGYETSPYYSEGSYDSTSASNCGTGFQSHSCCYGAAAKERIKQAKAFLRNTTALSILSDTINHYTAAKAALDKIDYASTPCYYSIMRAVGIDNDR